MYIEQVLFIRNLTFAINILSVERKRYVYDKKVLNKFTL